MARWLVKILKTLINTGESGIVYCMECRKYVGLTLTWDVLKLISMYARYVKRGRLTLTWDVLKSWSHDGTADGVFGLTLTWDVLKSFTRANTAAGRSD